MEGRSIADSIRELKALEDSRRADRLKAAKKVNGRNLEKLLNRATTVMPLLADADIESITIHSDKGNYRFYPDGRVEDADDVYDDSDEYRD